MDSEINALLSLAGVCEGVPDGLADNANLNNRNDRIETIENTTEARTNFGENYGAFEFRLTREQAQELLAGKVVAFDINGREYTGFLLLKK